MNINVNYYYIIMNFERKYALNENKTELVLAKDYNINIKPKFYCIDCKKKLEHVNKHERKGHLINAHFRSDPHKNYCDCKEKGIQYDFYDDIYNNEKDYHLDMINQIDENYKLNFIYFGKCVYDIKNKNNEYIIIRDSLLSEGSIKIYEYDNIIVKFILNYENRNFELYKIKDKYFITFTTKNDINYFNNIENVYIDTRKSIIIKLNNKQIKYNSRIYWLVDMIDYKELFNIMFKDIITIKDREKYKLNHVCELIYDIDIDIDNLLLNNNIELDVIIKKKRQEKEEEERKKIYEIKYFSFKNSYPITKRYTYDEYNKIKKNLDILNNKKIEIYKYDKKIETIMNKNYERFINNKNIEKLKDAKRYDEEQIIRKENCIKEENERLQKLSNEKIDMDEYHKINKERNEATSEFDIKYNQRYQKDRKNGVLSINKLIIIKNKIT